MAAADPCARGGDARFSPCGRYRWWLERHWPPAAAAGRPAGAGAARSSGRLLFIGLNPSRADAARDDATLLRLQGFARHWGFAALEVVNLFARVSPRPADLRRLAEPVGGENDRWIAARLRACDRVWLGWGNGGRWRGRDRRVLALIRTGVPPAAVGCIGVTAAGQPRHPLYAPAATRWVRWAEPAGLSHPERD